MTRGRTLRTQARLLGRLYPLDDDEDIASFVSEQLDGTLTLEQAKALQELVRLAASSLTEPNEDVLERIPQALVALRSQSPPLAATPEQDLTTSVESAAPVPPAADSRPRLDAPAPVAPPPRPGGASAPLGSRGEPSFSQHAPRPPASASLAAPVPAPPPAPPPSAPGPAPPPAPPPSAPAAAPSAPAPAAAAQPPVVAAPSLAAGVDAPPDVHVSTKIVSGDSPQRPRELPFSGQSAPPEKVAESLAPHDLMGATAPVGPNAQKSPLPFLLAQRAAARARENAAGAPPSGPSNAPGAGLTVADTLGRAWTLEQYASLRAELERGGAHRPEVRARFGIQPEDETALDEGWRAQLHDPEVAERFRAILDRYRAWLAQQR